SKKVQIRSVSNLLQPPNRRQLPSSGTNRTSKVVFVGESNHSLHFLLVICEVNSLALAGVTFMTRLLKSPKWGPDDTASRIVEDSFALQGRITKNGFKFPITKITKADKV